MKALQAKGLIPLYLVAFLSPIFVHADNEWCYGGNDASTAPLSPRLVDGSSQDEMFTVNDKVILYCCFTSKQAVHVTWYKDGNPLNKDRKYQFNESNQVITIKNPSALDKGSYRCEGSNQHGSQSWNISVAIFMPQCQVPRFDTQKKQLIVKKGENVVLSCNLLVQTQCRTNSLALYWRNPQGMVLLNSVKTEGNVDSNKVIVMKLSIKDVKKHEAGDYKCIAQSIIGNSFGTVQLNVQ